MYVLPLGAPNHISGCALAHPDTCTGAAKPGTGACPADEMKVQYDYTDVAADAGVGNAHRKKSKGNANKRMKSSSAKSRGTTSVSSDNHRFSAPVSGNDDKPNLDFC